MDDLKALQAAARLEQLGVEVRSAELREAAARQQRFAAHGNRALRRQAARAQRRKGNR